jgi:hypothetical protein
MGGSGSGGRRGLDRPGCCCCCCCSPGTASALPLPLPLAHLQLPPQLLRADQLPLRRCRAPHGPLVVVPHAGHQGAGLQRDAALAPDLRTGVGRGGGAAAAGRGALELGGVGGPRPRRALPSAADRGRLARDLEAGAERGAAEQVQQRVLLLLLLPSGAPAAPAAGTVGQYSRPSPMGPRTWAAARRLCSSCCSLVKPTAWASPACSLTPHPQHLPCARRRAALLSDASCLLHRCGPRRLRRAASQAGGQRDAPWPCAGAARQHRAQQRRRGRAAAGQSARAAAAALPGAGHPAGAGRWPGRRRRRHRLLGSAWAPARGAAAISAAPGGGCWFGSCMVAPGGWRNGGGVRCCMVPRGAAAA